MQYFGFDRTIGQGRVFSFDAGASEIIKPLLADYLLAGNGTPAVDYAVTQLVGSAVDWQLNVGKSTVTYVVKGTSQWADTGGFGWKGATAEIACRAFPYAGAQEHHSVVMTSATTATCMYVEHAGGTPYENHKVKLTTKPNTNKSITIASIITKIRANAVAGHAPSQAVVDATI